MRDVDPTRVERPSHASRRMPRGRWALALSAAAVVVLSAPLPAAAHTDLVATRPVAGSRSVGLVESVQLQFAEPIQAPFTAVVVSGGDGEVEVGPLVIRGGLVTAPLSGADDPGEYVVAYRATASDGHPVEGSFTFDVSRAQAAAAPGTTPREGKKDSPRQRPSTADEGATRPAVPGSGSTSSEQAAAFEPVSAQEPSGGTSAVASPVIGGAALVVLLGALLLRRRWSAKSPA